MSSSYFFLYARFYATTPRTAPDDYDISTDMVSKAEFRLNEAGEVAELGVIVEPEMGDAKIWFFKDGALGGIYCPLPVFALFKCLSPFLKPIILIQPYPPLKSLIPKCPNTNAPPQPQAIPKQTTSPLALLQPPTATSTSTPTTTTQPLTQSPPSSPKAPATPWLLSSRKYRLPPANPSPPTGSFAKLQHRADKTRLANTYKSTIDPPKSPTNPQPRHNAPQRNERNILRWNIHLYYLKTSIYKRSSSAPLHSANERNILRQILFL